MRVSVRRRTRPKEEEGHPVLLYVSAWWGVGEIVRISHRPLLGKIKPDREASEGQRHALSQGLLSLHHSWIQSAQDLKGSTCPLP